MLWIWRSYRWAEPCSQWNPKEDVPPRQSWMTLFSLIFQWIIMVVIIEDVLLLSPLHEWKGTKRDRSFPFLMAFTLTWHFSCCHLTFWLTNVFGNHQLASPPWFDLFMYVVHCRRLCMMLIDRPSILNSQMNLLFLDSALQKLQVLCSKSLCHYFGLYINLNQMSFGLLAACLEIYS